MIINLPQFYVCRKKKGLRDIYVLELGARKIRFEFLYWKDVNTHTHIIDWKRGGVLVSQIYLGFRA